jgi:hypothetical protein
MRSVTRMCWQGFALGRSLFALRALLGWDTTFYRYFHSNGSSRAAHGAASSDVRIFGALSRACWNNQVWHVVNATVTRMSTIGMADFGSVGLFLHTRIKTTNECVLCRV